MSGVHPYGSFEKKYETHECCNINYSVDVYPLIQKYVNLHEYSGIHIN